MSTVNACRVTVVSTTDEQPTSRDERRKRTEAAILDAARALFAETGFERATIRAVASRAGVDPALVMQYFGSKEGLFAAAAKWSDESQTVMSASRVGGRRLRIRLADEIHVALQAFLLFRTGPPPSGGIGTTPLE